jgi:7,8-dihydropterin-6-yl-methyl-4-(beta-D-ribofuranosyl)aminobenzene 5'-phosphate synthase
VAHVRGRGLVILTGCGHSAIANILRYGRKLTGESRIHAILGGFHLSGPIFEKMIAPTCEAPDEFSPDYSVAPTWSGSRRLSRAEARWRSSPRGTSLGSLGWRASPRTGDAMACGANGPDPDARKPQGEV